MKKNIIHTFILIFICLPLIASCAGKSSPSEYASFKSSEAYQKLDGRFKQAWEEAIDKKEEHRPFECLIKTVRAPSSKDKKVLRDAGFMYRTVIGQIITGSVEAKDVPAVAQLKFVKAMELAVPVSPKK